MPSLNAIAEALCYASILWQLMPSRNAQSISAQPTPPPHPHLQAIWRHPERRQMWAAGAAWPSAAWCSHTKACWSGGQGITRWVDP